jgi:hypothetical protein
MLIEKNNAMQIKPQRGDMLIEKKNHANKVPEGRHLNHYGRFQSGDWLSCSLDVQMEVYAKKRILVGSINMSPLWGLNLFTLTFLLRCRPSGAFGNDLQCSYRRVGSPILAFTCSIYMPPAGVSMLYLHLAYIKNAMPL